VRIRFSSRLPLSLSGFLLVDFVDRESDSLGGSSFLSCTSIFVFSSTLSFFSSDFFAKQTIKVYNIVQKLKIYKKIIVFYCNYYICIYYCNIFIYYCNIYIYKNNIYWYLILSLQILSLFPSPFFHLYHDLSAFLFPLSSPIYH